VILKIMPISVKSLVNNIKGNRPGNTEKKNNLMPFIVEFEKTSGLRIIRIIMKSIAVENNNPVRFLLMLKMKKFLILSVFVFVMLKYMLK
jgi:hypothetical protein